MPKVDVMRISDAKVLTEIPMELLLPHERQAVHNHGRSLHRLHADGGLTCREILSIVEGRSIYETVHRSNDEARLTELVKKAVDA